MCRKTGWNSWERTSNAKKIWLPEKHEDGASVPSESGATSRRRRSFPMVSQLGGVRVSKIGKILLAKFCNFLAGSFLAVSKRNFARKYSFDSIFQGLQDLHPFAPLQSQNFRKKPVWKNSNFREISAKKKCKCRKICQISKNSDR